MSYQPEFADFEPLHGEAPVWFLDRHPDDRLVALRAGWPVNRAGVWDAYTGNLLWHDKDVLALCWLPGGRQIVLLREVYERSPDHPRMIVSPLQSEISYFCERRTWPEDDLISRCQVSPPTGWLDFVTVSPHANLATVRWIEQHCAGVFLVALAQDGDRQLLTLDYRTEPNGVQGPVFSPDGRYLVLSCGRDAWWNKEDPEAPSPGGYWEIGHVAIIDLQARVFRDYPLQEYVHPGWFPDDLDTAEYEFLGWPKFVSTTEFTVTLPTGTERRFSVTEAGRRQGQHWV